MINIYTLDNGLRVVMESIPFVRSISFGLWVKNGSRNENQTTNGMSHFIEHMLFKGTKTRSAKDIADEMDEVGGQINAYTTKEYTCYYTRTLDTHFDVALDILTDMFFNARFDAADIQKERNVILEEISMYEDTPEDLVHDLLQFNIWPNDSLGLSILGTPESIGAFQRENFTEYFKNHYTPQNTVVAVAGNINEALILEKIKAAFQDFPVANKSPIRTSQPAYTPIFIKKDKDIEQVHMCVGFPGIQSGADEAYEMATFNTLFGGGMSSRLFQKIREEHGLAYSVYSYNASYADTGLFAVYSAHNPAQTADVLQLIVEEIKRFFTDKITDRQLSKTKEQLKSNYLMSLESSSNRMNSIGRSLLMLNRVLTVDEVIEKIDAVSLSRLYGLCERILQLDAMSLSIVGKTDFEGM